LVSGFKPFFSHRLCSSAFLAAIFFFAFGLLLLLQE